MKDSEQELDRQIMIAVQKGDRTAFAELYDRHCAWLLAVAFRILQNQRDAEDLLHDVFIEVWNKAASYNAERGSVRSWLAVRVRSRALDRIRALKIARKNQMAVMDSDEMVEESLNKSEWGLDHQKARQAVDKLSPKQRTVIQLSYFQGLTCQEISNRCEIPLGTVKSRLASALVRLRQHFDPTECSYP